MTELDAHVLVVGSGMSYHNMRAFNTPAAAESSRIFDGWLSEAVAKASDARDKALASWAKAPHARACHPREEHLLPLMVMSKLPAVVTSNSNICMTSVDPQEPVSVPPMVMV